MEQTPTITEDRTYRQDQVHSTPLEVGNKDLLSQYLSKAITVPQAASAGTEVQPPVPPIQHIQPQVTQASYIDTTIPEPKLEEDPVVPVKFDLLQAFEEFAKRLRAEENAKQADLSNLTPEQQARIAKLEEDAKRGRMIEEQSKKNIIQSLQASVNGWVPTALAYEKAHGLAPTDASALEKYLSVIPLHTDPSSRAMSNFLMTASKQVQTLQEQRRQDVNVSNKLFKERVALAEKLKSTEEANQELNKRLEELTKKVAELANQHQAQQPPQQLFKNPEPIQYINVPQAASKSAAAVPTYAPLDSLESTFFNASALTGGVDTLGFDNTYNLSKQMAQIFKQHMLPDPDNADIKSNEIWPERAFKRART